MSRGGARPGAGRPPKTVEFMRLGSDQHSGSQNDWEPMQPLTPVAFFLEVMRNPRVPVALRLRAGDLAARYSGNPAKGKKEIAKLKAAEVACGVFAPGPPPRFLQNNGD